MSRNPPEGYTRITPYLLYEDAAAAIDFLTSAFGFTERMRMAGEGGQGLAHAELEYDGSPIMLGTPGGEFAGPASTGVDSPAFVHGSLRSISLSDHRRYTDGSLSADREPCASVVVPGRIRGGGSPTDLNLHRRLGLRRHVLDADACVSELLLELLELLALGRHSCPFDVLIGVWNTTRTLTWTRKHPLRRRTRSPASSYVALRVVQRPVGPLRLRVTEVRS